MWQSDLSSSLQSRSVATTCCGCIGRSFQEFSKRRVVYSIAADLYYGPPECLLGRESFALSGWWESQKDFKAHAASGSLPFRGGGNRRQPYPSIRPVQKDYEKSLVAQKLA